MPLDIHECPSRDFVVSNCLKRLQRVQIEMNKAKRLAPANNIARQVKGKSDARRNVRRGGVRLLGISQIKTDILVQTFVWRKRIVEAYRSSDPVLWDNIQGVLDTLDRGAMSSDHTDDDCTPRAKRVSRARLPWRAPGIAVLMEAIESYPLDSSLAGNKAFPRNFKPDGIKVSAHKAVPGLPKSFYDPLWLQAQSQTAKHNLRPAPSRPIPELHLVVGFA